MFQPLEAMSRIVRFVIISAPGPAALIRITTMGMAIIMTTGMTIIMTTGMTITTTPIRMPNTRWGRNRFVIANPVKSNTG